MRDITIYLFKPVKGFLYPGFYRSCSGKSRFMIFKIPYVLGILITYKP